METRETVDVLPDAPAYDELAEQEVDQALHSNESFARVLAYYSPVFFWLLVIGLSAGIWLL